MSKKRLAILFGGKSEEHEVSIMSCASVLSHINQELYVIHVLGITKDGIWRYVETAAQMQFEELKEALDGARSMSLSEVARFFDEQVDVVFPVLHGPFGEDGTLQGFLEILEMPYVGAGVASSVVCMDKAYMKTILASEGIPMSPFHIVLKGDDRIASAARISTRLTYPLFVKPANLGSSVGIRKVKNEIELLDAIDYAFLFDEKVIVEQGVSCREIECGVLGNGPYEISCVGEIIASHEFYDYDSKYFDEGKSRMVVPAAIEERHAQEIRSICEKTATVLGVKGLSRIDFFIDLDTDKVLFNEINTMPGFTAYSMYPSLFHHSGIPYTELIDRLIGLALGQSSQEGHS